MTVKEHSGLEARLPATGALPANTYLDMKRELDEDLFRTRAGEGHYLVFPPSLPGVPAVYTLEHRSSISFTPGSGLVLPDPGALGFLRLNGASPEEIAAIVKMYDTHRELAGKDGYARFTTNFGDNFKMTNNFAPTLPVTHNGAQLQSGSESSLFKSGDVIQIGNVMMRYIEKK